jgi:hypothetical protein
MLTLLKRQEFDGVRVILFDTFLHINTTQLPTRMWTFVTSRTNQFTIPTWLRLAETSRAVVEVIDGIRITVMSRQTAAIVPLTRKVWRFTSRCT